MTSQDGAAQPPAPPKRPAPGEQPSPEVLVTYKRRRTAARGASSDPGAPCATTIVPCSGTSGQDGHQILPRHWITWRNTLEGFLQSPGVNKGGGIQSCIQDALRYNCCQSVQKDDLNKGQGASEEHPAGVAGAKEISSSIALKDATAASLDVNTAMCSNALLDILVSEKFAMLCDLLVRTFHVSKVHEVIDLGKIDTNMRNGNYSRKPALFNDHIQQIWEKFEQVGREMTSLASNLPIISRASYQKQASGVSEIEVAVEHRIIEETSLGGFVQKIPKDSNTTTQFSPCDSGHSTIPKRSGTCGLGRTCTCKQCGTSAEEEKSLICDGCDTTYHFDCVKRLHPAMTQIPDNWHCPACSSNKGKGKATGAKKNVHDSLHGDCPLCDKLEVVKKIEPPEVASGIEVADEREGSSVPSVEEENEPDLYTTALSKLCKHCGTCEDDDKQFLVCGHPYCPYKFYHIRCLRTSQIALEKQKNLECWYCPSCLCRGCFKNKDDEEITLCDGCDEAYHVYCMTPKRTCVPKGHWYCPLCSVRRAREGMQRYEKSVLKKQQHISGKRASQSVRLA